MGGVDIVYDGGSDGLLEVHYVPLCPNCGSEKIFRRYSVKRVTRAEWEAQAPERAAWEAAQRARGRFILNLKSPGWPEDWTECWTRDQLTAVVCDNCEFAADTDEPFTEARKRFVEAKAEARQREFERTSALPLDDPDHWCDWCEQNAYDQIDCDSCKGEGCPECNGHGYFGYSW